MDESCLMPFCRRIGNRFQFVVLVPNIDKNYHDGVVTLYINGKCIDKARFSWFPASSGMGQPSFLGFGKNTLGYAEIEVPEGKLPVSKIIDASARTNINGIFSEIIKLM